MGQPGLVSSLEFFGAFVPKKSIRNFLNSTLAAGSRLFASSRYAFEMLGRCKFLGGSCIDHMEQRNNPHSTRKRTMEAIKIRILLSPSDSQIELLPTLEQIHY